MGHGQAVGVGVAGFGGVGHAGAAGVGQAQRAGHLVKGFAGGIVHRAAQNVKPGVVLHLYNVAVAAAGHQAQKGRFQVRVGQVQGGNVAPQMVHPHQRLVGRVGQPCGKADPHQHRANEARRKGNGHRIQIGGGELCVRKGLLHRGADELGVAAAGDFRHHAAVQGLFGHAGGDDVAHDGAAVLYNGGGGLVTAGFNA